MAGIPIDRLAEEVMKGLEEYSKLATDDMKKAAKKAADTVKNQIKETAPHKTGKYRASWTVKKEKETSDSVQYVIHSKNRYQIAHLLEFGHAKRNGGRVAGRSHIAPAETRGAEMFENEIRRSLEKNG